MASDLENSRGRLRRRNITDYTNLCLRLQIVKNHPTPHTQKNYSKIQKQKTRHLQKISSSFF